MPCSSDSTSTNLPSFHPRGIQHLLDGRPQGYHGSVLGRDHLASGVNWERRERLEQNFGRKKLQPHSGISTWSPKNGRFPKTSSNALRSHLSASLTQNKIFGSVLENREKREGGRGKKREVEQLIFDYRNVLIIRQISPIDLHSLSLVESGQIAALHFMLH